MIARIFLTEVLLREFILAEVSRSGMFVVVFSHDIHK